MNYTIQQLVDEIELTRTMLNDTGNNLTISASINTTATGTSVFVSLKNPYWSRTLQFMPDEIVASRVPFSQMIITAVTHK